MIAVPVRFLPSTFSAKLIFAPSKNFGNSSMHALSSIASKLSYVSMASIKGPYVSNLLTSAGLSDPMTLK